MKTNLVIGWPKVALLTLSKDKVIIVLATIVCSFLCPIFISCSLYALMICIKKRKFLNKIVPATKTMDVNIESILPVSSNQNDGNDVENQERSINIETQDQNKTNQIDFHTNSNGSSLEDFIQDQPTDSIDNKQMAQITSAKRSLVTNLICISIFFVGFLMFLLPVEIRIYFNVFIFTLIKGLMPVLTALANFGTVQSVFVQYKEHFCQSHVIKFIFNK